MIRHAGRLLLGCFLRSPCRESECGRLGVVLLLVAIATPLQAGSLATRIEEILERPAAQRAFWGIKVVELAGNGGGYEYNANKLFVPASNAKLFSTALGLARLGPQHRFTTTVLSSVPQDNEGIVDGDLILVGGGDPNLSSRVVPYNPNREFDRDFLRPIRELAEQIHGKGIRKITGDLVGDDTRYVWQPHAEGWSVDDPTWGYGAPASALSFNDNVISVRVLPGRAAGRPARIDFRPDLPYFKLENRTRTARSRTVARMIKVAREPGTREITVWGGISIRSRGRNIPLAVDDPALFAAVALRRQLERLGVMVEGEVRSRHTWPHEVLSLKQGPLREHKLAGTEVARLESLPLSETLIVINKESQNLHAEMLLREVAYLTRGVGSFEAGIEELESFLLEAGLKPWEFEFNDASGLSRKDLVSPAATVKLLQYMWQSPLRDTYLNSLPLAGEDGTLDWRFSRTSARGRIRAKTGTLSNVTALSGYADAADGRQLAFSVFVNNFGVPTSYIRKIVDEICVAMITESLPVEPPAQISDAEGPAVAVPSGSRQQ